MREEIDLVPLDEGDVTFNHDVLKKLPYLNAVINETMRIDPVAAGGLQRYTDRDVSLGSDLMLPENVNKKKRKCRMSFFNAFCLF